MIVLITYDITTPKTLKKTHAFLKNYGINTQKSVFECKINEMELKTIRNYCRDMLNLDRDSVRIYKICKGCMEKVLISGQGIKITQLDYMVI